MTVSQTLRRTMESRPEPRSEIAAGSGIPAAVLSRFARGLTTLRGDHTDTLAAYLGLELKPKKTGTKTKRRAAR